jgi:AraC-like DNA-binding protein
MDSSVVRSRSARSDRASVLHFANRCQVLAGSLPFLRLTDTLGQVSSLRRSLPHPETAAARCVLAGLVTELVLRLQEAYAVRPPIAGIALARVAAARAEAEYERVPQLLVALEGEFRHLLALNRSTPGTSSTSPSVCRALNVLERCYTRPELRLSTVARGLGLSGSRCAHLLKERTGFTFRQHVHRLRVEHATRLLAQGGLSIKEISSAVGYGSASSLDRHFKEALGLTPGLWRQHHDQAARSDNE